MDKHIWASIHRLAVIAEKLEFQRFDTAEEAERIAKENNEDNAMHNRRPFAVHAWNRFRELNRGPNNGSHHPRWVFCTDEARNFEEYLQILNRHPSGTPMGTVSFRNSTFLRFNIKIAWTDPTQLTLEQTGTRRRCPITEEEFNKTGTPQEIYDHLNQVSQRAPRV
jgi:hypothetical protein